MNNKKEEIRNLINKLNSATKLYDEGQPPISDEEWDYLYFSLKKLEEETGIIFSDSPTQKIHYQVVNELKKVKHNHPMLSLDKTKNIESIKSFIKDRKYIAMAKMDGLTCSLWYKEGKLFRAETRGDGEIGEDITHNALVIPSIPNEISLMSGDFIIDGEIICTYDNFEEFSNNYKNPRNFASGSIRLLNSKECAKRNLTFVAWDLIEPKNYIPNSISNLLSFKLLTLEKLGFLVVPLTAGTSFEEDIKYLKELCINKSYPIDGIVFKYDNVDEYEAAGRTEHHFNGGLAYKFYDEEYKTKLLDIEWSMGRTGKLSPVAIFEPIIIDGTEVSRANLHNLSIMEKLWSKQWFSGLTAYVCKMNQIIPQITKIESHEENSKDKNLNPPLTCPICGNPTIIKQENESKVLYCNNLNCSGQLLNRIEHFFGKKGIDAKGISKATIEKLMDKGWVNSITDIFELDLHKDKWIKMQGFGEKSVNNILKSIEDSCYNIDSWRILSAAGVPLIGTTASKAIMRYCKNYTTFRRLLLEDFDFSLVIEGLGENMNYELHKFNYEELDDIFWHYFKEKEIDEKEKNNNLKGFTFVITGKLKSFKNRNEIKEKIEAAGGKVTGSVTKNTSFLINNDIESTSAKNKTAKKLNVPILTEQEFIHKFDF